MSSAAMRHGSEWAPEVTIEGCEMALVLASAFGERICARVVLHAGDEIPERVVVLIHISDVRHDCGYDELVTGKKQLQAYLICIPPPGNKM